MAISEVEALRLAEQSGLRGAIEPLTQGSNPILVVQPDKPRGASTVSVGVYQAVPGGPGLREIARTEVSTAFFQSGVASSDLATVALQRVISQNDPVAKIKIQPVLEIIARASKAVQALLTRLGRGGTMRLLILPSLIFEGLHYWEDTRLSKDPLVVEALAAVLMKPGSRDYGAVGLLYESLLPGNPLRNAIDAALTRRRNARLVA